MLFYLLFSILGRTFFFSLLLIAFQTLHLHIERSKEIFLEESLLAYTYVIHPYNREICQLIWEKTGAKKKLSGVEGGGGLMLLGFNKSLTWSMAINSGVIRHWDYFSPPVPL